MRSLKSKPTPVFECEALGTHWWIEAVFSNVLKKKIAHKITTFEQDYSRFLAESYIGRLNDDKILKNPPKELLDMLSYQQAMFDATNGVFNITVGSMLEKNGYGLQGRSGVLQRDMSHAITISNNEIRLQKDTRIDLGGFGKGWLIDGLAQLIRAEHISNFIINGGGDIVVGDQTELLYIEHPVNASLHVGNVSVKNGALASSSRYKRQWKKGGKHYDHIIDASGNTAIENSLLSVHIRAGSALLADTLATVFLIVDHQKRVELAQLFSIAFLEIRSDNTLWATADFGYLGP